jgi:hypothetical protein
LRRARFGAQRIKKRSHQALGHACAKCVAHRVSAWRNAFAGSLPEQAREQQRRLDVAVVIDEENSSGLAASAFALLILAIWSIRGGPLILLE